MTDQRARAAERRWRATGAVEDELRWLLESVRTGGRLEWSGYARLCVLAPEVAAEHLAGRARVGSLGRPALLAVAALGHAPAAGAAGGTLAPAGLRDALGVLPQADVVRLGFAAVGGLAVDEAEVGARASHEAIASWLACPCPQHAFCAFDAGEVLELRQAVLANEGAPRARLAWLRALCCVAFAIQETAIADDPIRSPSGGWIATALEEIVDSRDPRETASDLAIRLLLTPAL